MHLKRAIGTVLGTFLPILTWGQSTWVGDPAVQQQLATGEVAVGVPLQTDQSRMHLRAAVRINASPEVIWRVLTDCEHAATFIPGVKRCTRVGSAADGSWEVIEQEVKYSWLMPAITAVFRAEYQRPRRIVFRRISGDLKDEEGTWLLEEAPQDAAASAVAHATIVEYELYVDPGFWVPRVLVRHSLRSELPAALAALRTRAESSEAAGSQP
ncbi:MAG: cyclase/dehydrase [Gammaproteobacteria bacterium]|nr:cyclase/dehydrase [Gammaproteobacteria bacterium]